MLHSVYFDLDALASSSDDELVDVRKCKDLSVTVLYKPDEDNTPAKSEMAGSATDSHLESGTGDVRKVVRHRDEPMGSQMAQPVRPRSRHGLSAPTVDLVTGKCKPGKMIRTVSASPLMVYMTVSCKPEPDYVQQGVNADVLPPTDSVGMTAADVNTSTPVVTAPGLRGRLSWASCRSHRSCCRRLGGRPRRRLRCHGARQKTRRRRFRPIV